MATTVTVGFEVRMAATKVADRSGVDRFALGRETALANVVDELLANAREGVVSRHATRAAAETMLDAALHLSPMELGLGFEVDGYSLVVRGAGGEVTDRFDFAVVEVAQERA